MAGLYDGIWGPAGGTIMFLGLLYFARLATYGVAGLVHVHQGVMLASGMMVGGFLGANLASTSASRIVRPALLVIVLLLAARVIAVYA